MEELPINKIKTSDAFLSYADNQLQYSNSQLIQYINFYSITRDKLIIPDAFLLNNRELENLLLNKHSEYYKLLEEGILIPALREGVNSFKDLFDNQNKRNVRDRCINPEYPKLIDKKTQMVMWYDLDDISKNYTNETKNLVTNYHFMQQFGLLNYSNDLSESIEKTVEEHGVLTRTDMWNLSEKENFVPVQENIKKLGTTIYIPNIPKTYNINPVFPKQLAEYFKNVYITPYCGVSEESLNPKIEGEEHNVVGIPNFSMLKPTSINVIREMDEFQDYVKITNDTSKANDDRFNVYESYLMHLRKSIAAVIMKPEELQSINMKIEINKKQYAEGEKIAKIIGHLPFPGVILEDALEIVLTYKGKKMEKSLKKQRNKIYADSWLMLTQADIGDNEYQLPKT